MAKKALGMLLLGAGLVGAYLFFIKKPEQVSTTAATTQTKQEVVSPTVIPKQETTTQQVINATQQTTTQQVINAIQQVTTIPQDYNARLDMAHKLLSKAIDSINVSTGSLYWDIIRYFDAIAERIEKIRRMKEKKGYEDIIKRIEEKEIPSLWENYNKMLDRHRETAKKKKTEKDRQAYKEAIKTADKLAREIYSKLGLI